MFHFFPYCISKYARRYKFTMLMRVIIQKCPCGYVFSEKRLIRKQVIPKKSFLVRHPVYGYCGIGIPRKDEIVKRKVLDGDKEFLLFPILTKPYHNYESMFSLKESYNLLVCPKCGTVLFPKIAMTVKDTVVKDDD